MKKFTYVLVAVAAIVALSSCKQKPAPVAEEPQTEEQAPAEETGEEAPAETPAETPAE